MHNKPDLNKIQKSEYPINYFEDPEICENLDALMLSAAECQEVFADDISGEPLEVNAFLNEFEVLDDFQKKIAEIVNACSKKILDRLEEGMDMEALSIELLHTFQPQMEQKYPASGKIEKVLLDQIISEVKTSVTIEYSYKFISQCEQEFGKIEQSEIHKKITELLKQQDTLKQEEAELLIPYYQTYYLNKLAKNSQEEISEKEHVKYQEIAEYLFDLTKDICRTNPVPYVSTDLEDQELDFRSLPLDDEKSLFVLSKISMIGKNGQGVELGVSRMLGELTAGAKIDFAMRTFFEKSLGKEPLYDKMRAETLFKLYKAVRELKTGELDMEKYETCDDFIEDLMEKEDIAEYLARSETENYTLTGLCDGYRPSRLAYKIAEEENIELRQGYTLSPKSHNRISPDSLMEFIKKVTVNEQTKKKCRLNSPIPYHEVASALKKMGCSYEGKGKGDHQRWKFNETGLSATVPDHGSSGVKPGTLGSFLKSIAGIKINQKLEKITDEEVKTKTREISDLFIKALYGKDAVLA